MEVRRIPPCPDYDIRGTEKWLEDMAKQGCRLCEGHAFQYGFAYFIKEQPRSIRYRIMPAKKVPQRLISPNSYPEPPEEETLRFHEEFGWRYVTYRGQFWIFACDDPKAPEMDTDPRVQAIALAVAEKRLREHLIRLLVYGILFGLSREVFLCSTLAVRGFGYFWPLIAFIALTCVAWLPGLVHVIRFRKELKQGRFPENTTFPSPAKAHAQFLARFLPFLWLFVMVWHFNQPLEITGDTLTMEMAAELDVVTVADLFPEAEITYINSNNSIYSWQTDAADCLDLSERFRLTLPDGTTTTGYWDLCRYETTFDWIAAGCAWETRFIDWLRGDNTLIPLNIEGADWVRGYHVDQPRLIWQPHDILLLQKDNVYYKVTLYLYDEFPISYALEEIAAALIANERSANKGEQ